MREIVFDTETTGLDPQTGDKLVEMGCIELVNRIPTGNSYHAYYNPQRDMPMEAEQVHGLSAAFLSDKPLFSDLTGELLDFIEHIVGIRLHNLANLPESVFLALN
mgnify:CR=1 FL=1